jgi:hypothetical protein
MEPGLSCPSPYPYVGVIHWSAPAYNGYFSREIVLSVTK